MTWLKDKNTHNNASRRVEMKLRELLLEAESALSNPFNDPDHSHKKDLLERIRDALDS